MAKSGEIGPLAELNARSKRQDGARSRLAVFARGGYFETWSSFPHLFDDNDSGLW